MWLHRINKLGIKLPPILIVDSSAGEVFQVFLITKTHTAVRKHVLEAESWSVL